MKIAYIIIAVFVAHVWTIHAEDTIDLNVSLDFSDHLDGEARWQLGNKAVLTLKMDGDSTSFLLGDKKEQFRLDAPEYVDEAVVSEDGKLVVFAIMKARGRGANYSTLLLVKASGNGLEVRRVLKTKQRLFGDQRWWVSDLGAVSNDGERILVRLGVMSPPKNNRSRVIYSWYTL